MYRIHLSDLVLFVGVTDDRLRKSLRLYHLKLDWSEIWQELFFK